MVLSGGREEACMGDEPRFTRAWLMGREGAVGPLAWAVAAAAEGGGEGGDREREGGGGGGKLL